MGPFADVGKVGECLITTSLGLSSKGKTVVNCLLGAITDQCINTLPSGCAGLEGATGLALVPKIAECTLQLGPFAVGETLTCLTKGLTKGDDIISCLLNALGLSAPSPGGGGACVPGGQACVKTLPEPCDALKSFNGLDLLQNLAGCTASLGVLGASAATRCLAPSTILGITKGSNLVSCLLDALSGVCIAALPASCSGLADLDVVQLAANLPKCVADLGPFAVGPALDCLTPSKGSGKDIVQCVTAAVFGALSSRGILLL